MKKIAIVFIVMLFIVFFIARDSHVDYFKKLSEDEVYNYVSNELKKIYNEGFTIELISKKEITLYRDPFPGAGAVAYGTARNAYRYVYKITDSDNIIAYAYYSDAYYEKGKYCNSEYTDNYDTIKEKSETINRDKQVIYDYFEEDEINKIEFDSSDASKNANYYDLYLKVYFKYKINNISSELYAKLHNLSYDLDCLNSKITYEKSGGKYNTGTYIDVKAIFLDDPENTYDIDTIYGLGQKLIPDDYFEYEHNLVDRSKQDVYNELIDYLTNIVRINSKESKIISDAFLKYSKYYIYNVESISHQFYSNRNTCVIYIENMTKENNPLGVRIDLVFNEQENNYIGNDISIMDGKAKNATTIILFNKIH